MFFQFFFNNKNLSLFFPLKQNRLTIRLLGGLKVPGAGIEPARHCYHWILSPARLPIPPPGQMELLLEARHKDNPIFFLSKYLNEKDLLFRFIRFTPD